MDTNSFCQFLAERPAINQTGFAQELGIDRVNFQKIIAGLRQIPRAKRVLFLAVAQKYGFVEPSKKLQVADKQCFELSGRLETE